MSARPYCVEYVSACICIWLCYKTGYILYFVTLLSCYAVHHTVPLFSLFVLSIASSLFLITIFVIVYWGSPNCFLFFRVRMKTNSNSSLWAHITCISWQLPFHIICPTKQRVRVEMKSASHWWLLTNLFQTSWTVLVTKVKPFN